MAARPFKNNYLRDAAGIEKKDQSSLEMVNILVSATEFPKMVGHIARFYSSMRIPMPLSSKKTWREMNTLLSISPNQLIIIVRNISTPSTLSITIDSVATTPPSSLSGEPDTTFYYIIDKVVIDEFVPKSGRGLVAVMGKDEVGNYFLYLLRQDLSIPIGGGGPPYAGAKIPNG